MGLANEGLDGTGAELPRIAPDGFLWVCLACGKTSRDRMGEGLPDWKWDESCFLNSRLCAVETLTYGPNGRVTHVTT